MSDLYAWVADAVDNGGEVVTSTRRLARELRQAHAAGQVASGIRSWHTPRILPWSAWLGSLLDRSSAPEPLPLRINTLAAGILWERLLREHAPDRILNTHSLVRQAQQTWQRLSDWCVPLAELRRCANSEDERLFAAMAADYQRTLDANRWIDQAGLARCVARLISDGFMVAPGCVTYAGFDRVAPAAAKLFGAIEEAGANIAEAPRGPRNNRTVTVASCVDSDAELRAAGNWARNLLQQTPDAALAIACPGLEQLAPRAARLLREGLAPGWQYAADRRASAVDVSYGRRLSEYPLISIALLWLTWTCRGLSARDISVLLRSPFAGHACTDGRSQLEMKLRSLPDRSWRPASLAAALRRHGKTEDAVDWLQRVDAVARMDPGPARLESPAVWAARVDQLLQELGWPGEAALDSVPFQLANRWRDLLNELSRLDLVMPRINLAEAVRRLASLAGDTIYQPESLPGAVRLLGTLEAAGLRFDHLWVCHLDARQWPPQGHSLSLVSKALQRKFAMPDATPADTLEFARNVLQRLATSAPDVVLSWAATEQDMELEASPLLATFESNGSTPAADPGWHASSLCGGNALYVETSDPAPAIRQHEKVQGGAATVQQQLQEPFSAFAYCRLGVRDLQSIETGLPALTRGNIIHAALHHLLAEKPSSAVIAAWGEADQRIEAAIDAALKRHLSLADGVLSRLLAIERRRLRAILRDFLRAESKRQAFQVVSLEESIDLERHGVTLRLRADRIDRLQDGSLLIIDYKTGAIKSLLDRNGQPKDLQLVVYASAIGATVGGMVLVNVDSRGIVYRGAGGSVEWDRLPPELWPKRLAAWQQRVDEALLQFAAGDVRLNPAQSAEKRRPLGLLSRVEEIRRGL